MSSFLRLDAGRAVLCVCAALLCAGLACGGGPVSAPSSVPTGIPPAGPTATSWPATNDFGVRYCLYNPAAPKPPPPIQPTPVGPPTPYPTATLGGGAPVDAEGRARQMEVFRGLWNAVNDHYVDPGFNGRDWVAIGQDFEARIESGVSESDFDSLMEEMVTALGDEHSYFQSPKEVEEETRAIEGQNDFVGIGMLAQNTPEGDATVIVVFAGGPAAEAGLRPHDTILAVDGGPVRDEFGISRTRGPVGTTVHLTVRTQGGAAREMVVTRREVTGGLPVDSCVVPGTRIGYVLLPTFLDETIDDQVRTALKAMTADGPLDGLILDNRMNGGGLGSVAQAVLQMFLDGPQGAFVTRTERDDLVLAGEDVGGSQSVPLVVLVGPDTVSYGEVVSGILQHAGRATIVGQPTLGNVEQLRRYDFEGGWRAWIASATYEPAGLPAGIWEDTGIVPDVLVAGRWDEFNEADDPGVAAATRILLGN